MFEYRFAISISKIELFHDLQLLSVHLLSLLSNIWCDSGRWSRVSKEIRYVLHTFQLLQFLCLHIDLLNFDCFGT